MEEKNRLDRIEEKLDLLASEGIKKPKEKSFKIPFKARVGKSKVKKGWVTYCKILDNREVVFEKHPVEEQVAMVDEIPRIVTAEETLTYKGKPFVILPSWSTKPFSPSDNYQDTIAKGYAAQGWKLLLNRMKKEVITAKKQMSPWLIVGVIALIIGLGYFAQQQGLFK